MNSDVTLNCIVTLYDGGAVARPNFGRPEGVRSFSATAENLRIVLLSTVILAVWSSSLNEFYVCVLRATSKSSKFIIALLGINTIIIYRYTNT